MNSLQVPHSRGNTLRRIALRTALGLACLGAMAGPALAQEVYPSRPVSLVVPFPPGGSADIIGRILARQLSDALGQPVVVDNRPGAGTAVAASHVAKAPADGYTLFLSSGSTFTANPAIRSNLPYDPINSFDPIATVARIPLILLANKDVPVNTVKEFVAAIRATPDRFTYASFGTGTTSHFAGEIVLQAVGGRILHVPYKGSAQAMTDVIGGQVQFSFDTVTAAIPQIKSGKVKPIGVTTAQRAAKLPDVPSFAESGYADVDFDTWIMMVAPKGTPASVRMRLEQTLASMLRTQETQGALMAQGVEPTFASAAASSARIEKELPLMRTVAQRANIQAD